MQEIFTNYYFKKKVREMKLEKFEFGYNIPAKVGMDIKDVQTPSLIIDFNI